MSVNIRGRASADGGRPTGTLRPGEHLRAEIKRLALDQVAVSEATGVSRQSINNIINGRQPISRAMAGKLGRLTGHSSDYWLRDSFPVHVRPRDASRPDLGGPSHTAGAGVLVDYQIVRAVKDGIIGITPFVTINVRSASIDLTLGASIVTAGGEKIGIDRGKGFLLKAGGSVTARTKERVGLPRDYLGRLGTLERLCGAGIVMSHALHIHPGFDGHVQFCLFNAGGSPFRLRAGEPAIGLEIVRLGATPAGRRAATD